MANKLVVLSIDSLEFIDLKKLLQCPNFRALKDKLSVVQELDSIYPTLTYPIHTTMLTGKTPDEHGVFHNQQASLSDSDFNIMGDQWYWSKEYIKCETLVDKADENGLSVSTFCWPVTAFSQIGVNVPEIWPTTGLIENPREMYEKACSPIGFQRYYESYLKHFNWSNNEDMVTFLPEIALNSLELDKPDLLLCHAILLDHVRHQLGNQNLFIDEVLRQMDILVGRFIEVTKWTGEFDNTNFVILGDHGQIDIAQQFQINVLFVKHGFIELNSQGEVTDCIAYGFSAGFSCQIILKDNSYQKKVADFLETLQKDYPEYIQRVYSKEEAMEEEGLAGNFDFVLEGREGTLFGNKCLGEVIIPKNSPNYDSYRATHGHHPSKGDKPTLLAFGPDIVPNQQIKTASMLDVYPSFLQLLGLPAETGLKGQSFSFIKS